MKQRVFINVIIKGMTMKRTLKTITSAIVLMAVAAAAKPAFAEAAGQGTDNRITTGQGGMGHMTASAVNPCTAEKDLSVEDVRKIIAGRLAWDGNGRLKVGKVEQKNDDTYTADIVTADNSLVERIDVDRKSGTTRRADGTKR